MTGATEYRWCFKGLTGPVIDPIKCKRVDPKITVVWSAVTKAPKDWDSRAMRNGNNHSMVIRVDFGKVSYLLTGDIEEDALNEIGHWMYGSNLLDVDVLKVAHHGSYNGTTAHLLKQTTPEIAVIQMGPHTREYPWTAWKYGHPREVAVNMLLEGVTGRRKPKYVHVASWNKRERRRIWKRIRMRKAIYATGWDGHVVIEAATNGWKRRAQ